MSTSEIQKASSLLNRTSGESFERPRLLSLSLLDIPLLQAVQKDGELDLEEKLTMLAELNEIFRKNPEIPLKTSTNLGEEEPTPYTLAEIVENHRDKRDLKYERYTDAEQRGIVAWKKGVALLEEANPFYNIASASELMVKIPHHVYQDPHLYTPMMNVFTSLKIETMINDPAVLMQITPPSSQ